jgi:VanZ family protein
LELAFPPGFLCGVRKSVVFAKFWLPVLLWFVLIFVASKDSGSFQRSSRIIGPIVKWLLPNLNEAQVGDVVFFVRKCAHATEYAVLAWLFWRALRQHRGGRPGQWSWGVARLAWLCATIYAATDELHQCFVPNRQGSMLDVLLDSAGAAMGLGIIWGIGRWRGRWGQVSHKKAQRAQERIADS